MAPSTNKLSSEHLSQAASRLHDAEKDLISTRRQLALKSPQNVFHRPGFHKITNFALNARLRFLLPRSKNGRNALENGARSRGGMSFLSSLGGDFLPYSDFNSTAFDDTLPGTSYLEELELWNGFRGNYVTLAAYMIDCLRQSADLYTQPQPLSYMQQQPHQGFNNGPYLSGNGIIHDAMQSGMGFRQQNSSRSPKDVVIIQRLLRIEPKEMLLVQLNAKLRGQADSDLILYREHYRYPDERTSIAHFIEMYPLKLLLSPRDVLALSTYKQDADGTIMFAAQSLKHLLPESKGCQRAVLKNFGLKIEPYSYKSGPRFYSQTAGEHPNPGADMEHEMIGSKVTMMVSIDPSTWLPRFQYDEHIHQWMTSYLTYCESLVLSMKRVPHRIEKLLEMHLSALPSQDLKTEDLPTESEVLEQAEHLKLEQTEQKKDNGSVASKSASQESELERLRRIEKELDEELALLSASDGNESDAGASEGGSADYDPDNSVSTIDSADLDSTDSYPKRARKRIPKVAKPPRRLAKSRRRNRKVSFAADDLDDDSISLDSESSDLSDLSFSD